MSGEDAHARVKGLVHADNAAAGDGQIQVVGIDHGSLVGIRKHRSVQGQRAGLGIIHNCPIAQHVALVIAGHPDAVDPELIGVVPLGGERQILRQPEAAARGIGRLLSAVDAALPAGEGPTVGTGEAAFGQRVLLSFRHVYRDRVPAPLTGQKRDDHPLITAIDAGLSCLIKGMGLRLPAHSAVGTVHGMLVFVQRGAFLVGVIAGLDPGISVLLRQRVPLPGRRKPQLLDLLAFIRYRAVSDLRVRVNGKGPVAVAAVAASEGAG